MSDYILVPTLVLYLDVLSGPLTATLQLIQAVIPEHLLARKHLFELFIVSCVFSLILFYLVFFTYFVSLRLVAYKVHSFVIHSLILSVFPFLLLLCRHTEKQNPGKKNR